MIGPIDASNFHQLLIGALITQGGHHLNKARCHDVNSNFAVGFSNIDDILAKRLGNCVGNTFVAGIAGGRMDYRVTVPERRIFRCNCMMP